MRHALTLEDYAPARLWLATWLLDMGDLDGSEQAFTQILTKSGYVPFENAASTGLARIRLRQEQPKAALALLEPVVRVSEHPYPRRLLVRAARAAGQATNVTAPGRALAMNWPDPMRAQLQAYVRGFGRAPYPCTAQCIAYRPGKSPRIGLRVSASAGSF